MRGGRKEGGEGGEEGRGRGGGEEGRGRRGRGGGKREGRRRDGEHTHTHMYTMFHTCALWADTLGMMKNVFPKLSKLRYPE